MTARLQGAPKKTERSLGVNENHDMRETGPTESEASRLIAGPQSPLSDDMREQLEET